MKQLLSSGWILIFVLTFMILIEVSSTARSNPLAPRGYVSTGTQTSRGIDLSGINSYEQVLSWLTNLEKELTFVKIRTLGKSAENRSLLIIEIDPTLIEVLDQQYVIPTVFLDAGTHGREQITVTVALALINKIIDAITRNERSDFTKVKWYIAPLINPDGYEYSRTTARSWRKNRSTGLKECTGVDINRNWKYHWGMEEDPQPNEASDGSPKRALSSISWLFKSILNPQHTVRQLGLITPCSELFAGQYPFSEVESRLLSDLILNLTDRSDERLESYFSLHSMTGDQQLLFPYGYTMQKVPDYANLKALTHKMVVQMEKTAGRRYQYGSVAETLYQTSGLQSDWIYAVAGINRTFVVEMRDNYRINPSSLITKAFGELCAALQVLLENL